MLEKIDLKQKLDKKTYKAIMPELSERLYEVQKASWDAGLPVIILFEGWDAAGKGTSIQKLTSPLDPRGFKLYPIRAARTFEKKRPWLWRFWSKLPARGEWAIFDRSWYGRVLVERVEELIPESEWRRAYRDIVDFERTLADDQHVIVKFFLHISKSEQRRRFDELSKDPLTAWHVTPEDWEHHRRYDDWLLAYEEAFEHTDTEWGPWTIVEATNRRFTWVKIFQTIVAALEPRLGLPSRPLPLDAYLAKQLEAGDSEGDEEIELVGEESEPNDEDENLVEAGDSILLEEGPLHTQESAEPGMPQPPESIPVEWTLEDGVVRVTPVSEPGEEDSSQAAEA